MNKKKAGQYMTPDWVVTLLLDSIGFKGSAVLEKTIFEPSFGDGAFLFQIVERIVLEGQRQNKSPEEIRQILQTQVFGIEKDEGLYHQALRRLNQLLLTYGLEPIHWEAHLRCGDTLLLYSQYLNAFDYVVGNPPYVRVHYLSETDRERAKQFQFGKGIIDLYVIFYELGLLCLKPEGKLGYISPNSFMKNSSQKSFRSYLVEHQLLDAIYDFKTSKLFVDADTYTCICLLDNCRQRPNPIITYRAYEGQALDYETRLPYPMFEAQFKNHPWTLNRPEDLTFLWQNQQLPLKIRNLATVQNGIATNKDAVYIFQAFLDEKLMQPYLGKHTDTPRVVYFKDSRGTIQRIESQLLRRCVKASTFMGQLDHTYLLFPYEATQAHPYESQFRPLSEAQLSERFPLAYDYLMQFKDVLMKRNMDTSLDWFVFGRSQGIQASGRQKIVFKHVIHKETPNLRPYVLDADVMVYAGIYTTAKSSEDGQLELIRQHFQTDDFSRYCTLVGKDMAGGYVSVSTKMIQSFGIHSG